MNKFDCIHYEGNDPNYYRLYEISNSIKYIVNEIDFLYNKKYIWLGKDVYEIYDYLEFEGNLQDMLDLKKEMTDNYSCTNNKRYSELYNNICKFTRLEQYNKKDIENIFKDFEIYHGYVDDKLNTDIIRYFHRNIEGSDEFSVIQTIPKFEIINNIHSSLNKYIFYFSFLIKTKTNNIYIVFIDGNKVDIFKIYHSKIQSTDDGSYYKNEYNHIKTTYLSILDEQLDFFK